MTWEKEDIATCSGCAKSFVAWHEYCPSCGYPNLGDLFNEIKSAQMTKNSGLATAFSVEAVDMPQAKKKSKQRSRHNVIDGIVFDSNLEGQRYLYLKQLQAEGIVSALQPSIGNETKREFLLLPKTVLHGNELRPQKNQQAITYTPDFVYWFKNVYVIEDVKGKYGNSEKNRKKKIVGKPIIGADARLRHKLLQADYPHSVFVIVINPTSDAGKNWSE